MSDAKLPSIFVSHGAPTLALDAGETGAAWQKLARDLPRPKRGALRLRALDHRRAGGERPGPQRHHP